VRKRGGKTGRLKQQGGAGAAEWLGAVGKEGSVPGWLVLSSDTAALYLPFKLCSRPSFPPRCLMTPSCPCLVLCKRFNAEGTGWLRASKRRHLCPYP